MWLHLVWMESKEQHGTSDVPGRSFLDVSQRRCPSGLHSHLEQLGPRSLLVHCAPMQLPAVARVAITAVFTGFVWELSVGLGNSWEFLSNYISWGWREAKYNSLAQGPRRGQWRKSGEVAP